MPELSELLDRWPHMPAESLVNAKVAAAVLSLSERSIRYHEKLPRVYLGKSRYAFRVADIRKLLSGEGYGPRLSFAALPLFSELAPNFRAEYPDVWQLILNLLDDDCRREAERLASAGLADITALMAKPKESAHADA